MDKAINTLQHYYGMALRGYTDDVRQFPIDSTRTTALLVRPRASAAC